MNIRSRITLLVALTFIAISIIGGFAVYQSRGNAIEVKKVTQGVVPSALASTELVGQLKDVQVAVMLMVAAPDKNLVDQARERLLNKQATLQAALDKQLTQADSAAQKGLIAQLKESVTSYFDAIKETADLKLAGKNGLAEATLAASVGIYLQEMEQIIGTLQVEKARSKDTAIDALNSSLLSTTTTIGIVTALAIILLTSIGILLYRQITRPISDMAVKMTEIATSQDFTLRVPVKQMDEIGRSMVAFNSMVEKIQQSSELVKQKSADIHAMLQNVPQGILTVEAPNHIHPEYSAYLEAILESQSLAGKSLMDAVFANSSCNTDILSQIEATIAACLGEDEMNFAFNAHLLPTEITKTFDDGRSKVIDLNWSPITDDTGVTQRILVCLRDVTQLRALEIAAQAQKRELAMIGEILGVKQEKFQEFAASAKAFIEENRTLITSTSPEADANTRKDAVALLFRNMHTIKGNARTYGLLHLTHLVHEAEQSYDALRNEPNRTWDSNVLLTQLDEVKRVVDDYVHISEVKLGRKGPGRRGGVDKFLMVEKSHVEATLELLEKADVTSLASAREVLRKTRHNLELIGTENLNDVLAGVIDSIPSLASELGKEPPQINVVDNGILVRTQIADVLRNTCMHVFRNAVDHGIELADERVKKGKAPAGKINLSTEIHGDKLFIRIADDGRGLAVQAIKEKAIAAGRIDAESTLSDELIAELVFASGFSTATTLTEISGRGVGMDAVKEFVAAASGSIHLELAKPDGGQTHRSFTTVICLPATSAVAPILKLMQRVG